MCMRACVCVCHYLLHATLSLIPLGFLLKAAKEKEIMESKGRRRSVIKDTGCETGKCRDFLLQNSLFKGKSVPERGGGKAIIGGPFLVCESLLAFKICGRASPAPGAGGGVPGGEKAPVFCSGSLRARGCVRSAAVWASCPWEPAVSWLLTIHPFWGLTSRLHCVRVHLPEIKAQQNSLGDLKVSFASP